MTKVYLHIGLPKTATTAIQNWLIANASNLRKAGLFTFEDVCFGHRLAIAAIDERVLGDRSDVANILRIAPLRDVTSRLANAARDASIDAVIISSEYFSLANPERVKQLLLDVGLADISIVLVLRRQDRYIESGYSQDITGAGGTATIGNPVFNPLFDWYALTRSWADVFSPYSLLLHTYEKASADGQIIERVIGSLNQKVAAALVANPVQGDRVNASLPAELIEFKRLANKAGATDILAFLELAARNGIGGKPFRMNTRLARAFLDLYRESNRKVAKEFLGRSGELFDESDLKDDRPGNDYTGKLPVETLAMLLAFQMQQVQEAQAKSAGLQSWLLDTTQSVTSLCGWLQADLLALKENINNQLAQLPQRARHDTLIGIQPLYGEIQAQAERVGRLRDMVNRLEDLTSPRRLVRIGWNRLTARMRRT